jgi:hypothetical protein
VRRPNILAACFLGAASITFAQIEAPQLGWIPDGARIRPVYGIPAAAAVGAPIPAGQDFAQIAASPARILRGTRVLLDPSNTSDHWITGRSRDPATGRITFGIRAGRFGGQ